MNAPEEPRKIQIVRMDLPEGMGPADVLAKYGPEELMRLYQEALKKFEPDPDEPYG